MKTRKKIAAIVVTTLLTVGISLNFSGCSKDSPLQPSSNQTVTDVSGGSLAKEATVAPIAITNDIAISKVSVVNFLSTQNSYDECVIELPNRSSCHVAPAFLTPPPSIEIGDNVAITVLVEKDEIQNREIYTFGPSGCQFDPPLQAALDWSALNSDSVKVYYIDENDNYMELTPILIDYETKIVIVPISHFSRYAVGSDP